MRKNEILPVLPDKEQIESIFRRIQEYPDKPQSKRVERVLELLSGLRADLSTQKKSPIISELGHLLEAYRWTIRVSHTLNGLRAILLIGDRGTLSKDDLWEREAIRDLLDLVPHLEKRQSIRRCADAACGEWIFAAKGKKQFCDGNCRQHHYDSSSVMRTKKKHYMRQHRRDLKERDERLKRRIGFRSRPSRGEA